MDYDERVPIRTKDMRKDVRSARRQNRIVRRYLIPLAIGMWFFLGASLHFTTAGYYVQGVDYLVVHGVSGDPAFLEDALMHEYAHAIWHEVYNRSERRAWIDHAKQSDVFVSTYAQTRPAEDFAETFEYGVECTGNLSKVRRFDPVRGDMLIKAYEAIGS